MSSAIDQGPETVRVSGGEQVAALVPYILGFVPQRSVVVIYLDGNRVATTMRVDADACAGDVLAAARAGSGSGCEQAVVVLFEDEGSAAGQGEAVLDEMSAALVSMGTRVHAEVIVCGESVRLRGQAPSSLSQYAHVAAPFVAMGVSPLPSRQALERAMTPRSAPEGLADALSAPGPVDARECAQAWATILDPASGPVAALPVDVLEAAMVGLADVETRDAIVARVWPLGGGEIPAPLREALGEALDIVAEVLPTARAADGAATTLMVHRLVALAGVTPAGRYRDDVIAVAATGLYWSGQGAAAAILLEEAAGHGNTMAELLARMLQHGLPYRS